MARVQPTAWVGWIYFASAMLMVAGGIQMIAGLTGIFYDDFYVMTQTGHLLAFDYTTWGWTHLLIGTVMIAAGVALIFGKLWAQILALIIAVLSAIVNLAFIGTYPLWSITVLIIDAFIIYAITLHGNELKENN